jgi:ABC-type branched-subunit amino acid transport system ATPase component
MPTFGRPSCLPNTRLDVIKVITDWIEDEGPKPVFWLFGQTGSGKSTISTTIADMCRERRRLGAFIFFNRDVKDRSDPSLVIRTLAYKLASFDI